MSRGETCPVLQDGTRTSKHLLSSLCSHGASRWTGNGRFSLLSSLVLNHNIRKPKHGHSAKAGFLPGVAYGSRMNRCTDRASMGYDLDFHTGNQIRWKKILGLGLWGINREETKKPNEPAFSQTTVSLCPSSPPSLPPPLLQTLIGYLLFARTLLGTHHNISFFKMIVSI